MALHYLKLQDVDLLNSGPDYFFPGNRGKSLTSNNDNNNVDQTAWDWTTATLVTAEIVQKLKRTNLQVSSQTTVRSA